MPKMSDDIIKTTAKIQEAEEPIRQKPIIQINKEYLSNNVRASTDSGRDNPFRPDGEIYRSADPIVDYYKYGPNQSRAQSPSDSQLLLNGKEGIVDGKKVKKKRRRKEAADDTGRRPCWRRWLCCCCCCFDKCCQKKETEANTNKNSSKSTTETKDNPKDRQTKVVVLKDELRNEEFMGQQATSGGGGGGVVAVTKLDTINSSAISNSPGEDISSQRSPHKQTDTQPKTTNIKSTSKCIVS